MMKFRKGMAMLLAAVLCAGLPAHTAKAEFCSGAHSLYFAGPGVEEYNYSHEFKLSITIDGLPVYDTCEVNKKIYYTRVCCSNCDYYTQNNYRIDEVHSKKDDPDHK